MCPCQQGHGPRGGRNGLAIKTATQDSCLRQEGAELGRRMGPGVSVPGCVLALSSRLNEQAALKHAVLLFPRL